MAKRCLIKGCYQYYHQRRFERLLRQIDLCSRAANNYIIPGKSRTKLTRLYQQLVKKLSRDYSPEYAAAKRDNTIEKIIHPYLVAGSYNGDGEEPENTGNSGDEASNPLEKKALNSLTITVVLTPE